VIRCAGVEVHVEQAGEGRPVLLLHGFPDSHVLWRNQIPALAAAGHSVVAPDLPGYGRSEAPGDVDSYRLQNVVQGLVELLDQLGIESAAVAGHDWGAAAAWVLAAYAPERVDHLAVLSVGHPAVPRSLNQLRDFWYMLLFQYPEAEELLSEDDWALFRGWMRGAEDLDRYIDDLSRPGRLTAALNWYRANHSIRAFVHGGRVPSVACPALGVWSTHDFACGEQQVIDSADHVTGPWRYERIDNAGHWIPLAAPRRLNDLLVEFLSHYP
jgi:pimeloyl-ACP methyl ester carboxylesterase